MILDIFVVFVAISLFLVWFGFYSKRRYLSIIGFSILFIFSSWILLYSSSGQDAYGLQYKIGSNITTVGSNTVITYNYETYNDNTTFWVGFLFAVIFAISILFFSIQED